MTTTAPPEAPADCPLCPRLVEYRQENERLEPSWFNGAVPSFLPEGGEEAVRVLIVGLAPGRMGANRTGRPFTGDWAGDLLYATLLKFGLAAGEYDKRPDDSLRLKHTMVTNAVRCAPPENKPTGHETTTCRNFLSSRIEALPNLKTLVCLGKISHDSTVRALGARVAAHPFGHDTSYAIETGGRALRLRSSYHCSRYNTNTGKLTTEMFETVIGRAAADVGAA
ncbi:uracil-DNA glycosylase [Parvularcula maris]|uniref:Type-5 uracil-DNA glycosylase n=1 Tax=Parvularcula maris TaxID=2965077 RepID=A0A9X2L9J8_9PROT|nr:uracil-DNA glycosylase [Parvularcula maris]